MKNVILNRLQVLAERKLPGYQCCFRTGCGCADMILTIRHLTEKTIEHWGKEYLIFVDFKKA